MVRGVVHRRGAGAKQRAGAVLAVRLLAGWMVATLGSAALVGCNDEDKVLPTARPAMKRLVIGSTAEPDLLNPLFAETAAAREIIFLMNRELTMHNDFWELVPDLAEEIPTVENGQVRIYDSDEVDESGNKQKKMEVIWHIRKDAVWEDGIAVTADDYVFAWQVQTDPSQEIINRDLVDRIERMEAKGDDKKTLVVTWKEPYAFYAQFRVHYALPRHALAPRYHLEGGGTRDMKKDPYSQRPLSNGPFKFRAWKAGEHITLEKNERYPTPPKVDEVTIRFLGTTAGLESALLAGDLDAVAPMAGFSVPQVEELRKAHGDRFKYYAVPGLVWAHVDFNLETPPLDDKRVRHAIAHAVDRKGIIDALFYGRYTLSHTFLPPRHWGYHPGVKTYPYDPERAKALLDEAGWKEEKPGGIRKKGKERLSLKISAVTGVKDIEDLEQVMQSNLKDVGIELVIDNKLAKTFFGEFGRYRKFPHMSFYSWVMDPTVFGNTMWQSDMIPTERNNWQGQNYPAWRSEEATKLLQDVPSVLIDEQRRTMMHRVQELWAEDLPALPMYFRPVVGVTTQAFIGYRPTGTRTPVSWNAHEWDLVPPPSAPAPKNPTQP